MFYKLSDLTDSISPFSSSSSTGMFYKLSDLTDSISPFSSSTDMFYKLSHLTDIISPFITNSTGMFYFYKLSDLTDSISPFSSSTGGGNVFLSFIFFFFIPGTLILKWLYHYTIFILNLTISRWTAPGGPRTCL